MWLGDEACVPNQSEPANGVFLEMVPMAVDWLAFAVAAGFSRPLFFSAHCNLTARGGALF